MDGGHERIRNPSDQTRQTGDEETSLQCVFTSGRRRTDLKERQLCLAGCCHALLPMLVLPLSGMAASSLLMQRYSPSIAMIAKPIRFVSHHAQECGKPA